MPHSRTVTVACLVMIACILQEVCAIIVVSYNHYLWWLITP
jgi:hypothetical protein